MLKPYLKKGRVEVGCDEAGRGCLAGPVFAAAVIFPENFKDKELRDSKKLSPGKRAELVRIIEKNAIAHSVAQLSPKRIDEINILQASIQSMHRALDDLNVDFDHILVDGNKFNPYLNIAHTCIIKGDDKFLSIAAASILAKHYRDEYMIKIDLDYPDYGWRKNKGYPTLEHRESIRKIGLSPYHRKTFRVSIS